MELRLKSHIDWLLGSNSIMTFQLDPLGKTITGGSAVKGPYCPLLGCKMEL